MTNRTKVSAFDQVKLFQTAGFRAASTELDLTALRENGFEHALQVVVTLWRNLIGQRATDRIAEKEHGDFDIRLLPLQRHRQPEGVVRLFRAVRCVLDNEEYVHRFQHSSDTGPG